jgi:argininosuccinate lyase
MQEGKRGKIKKAPAPELIKYLIRPGIESDISRAYQTILDVNKAHVIMLAEEEIIKRDVAAQILKVTEEIARMKDNPTFEISSDMEDLYFNFERYLIERTGIEVGGQQHTGRSRNDILATTTRIDSRKIYLQLCELFLELREALVKLAKNNLETVMAGYTHLQPSEPITFAHYCSAILNALERDYVRISRAWEALNICPLGGGSSASTTFPINRETTATLLGFDTYMNNSMDSVAARDYAMEIVGALALAANTFSRFAHDLYIWTTPEYGYVEVDDSVAVCSSIMPQKKNPITLEHVKGKAAHLEAFWVSIFSTLKNIAYSHCRDSSTESVRFYWNALQEMEADIKLLTVTVKTLKVNKKHMVSAAAQNFSTVTELANYLVRYDNVSFRAAHEVVAMLVDYMMTHNKKSNEIHLEQVTDICKKMLGKATSLTDEQVSMALDPARNAKSKKAHGGSAPEEVIFQLEKVEKMICIDKDVLSRRQTKIVDAKTALDMKADVFMNV